MQTSDSVTIHAYCQDSVTPQLDGRLEKSAKDAARTVSVAKNYFFKGTPTAHI